MCARQKFIHKRTTLLQAFVIQAKQALYSFKIFAICNVQLKNTDLWEEIKPKGAITQLHNTQTYNLLKHVFFVVFFLSINQHFKSSLIFVRWYAWRIEDYRTVGRYEKQAC